MKYIDTVFAKFISIVFNPFIVLVTAIVLGNLAWVQNEIGPLLFIIAVMIFLPLIAYVLKIEHTTSKKGNFFHFHNLLRSERNGLFLLALYIDFISILMFSYLGITYWMLHSIIAFILIGIIYLSNKYVDKVSIHAAIFTFSIFYLVNRVDTIFSLFLIALPIIMWARIKLHQHTWVQLFLGVVIGMAIGLLSWTI